MKALCLTTMIVAFLLLSTNRIQAQTTDAKLDHGIQLPQLTIEQKLDRASRNISSREIVAIAYAKSLGKNAEDFGKFYGDKTAFFWADIKGKGAVPFVQYWYRFLQIDKNSKMEIISVSEKTVKAKMTVYGETNLKSYSDIGVTLEEYASFYGKLAETLADYLGLDYKQKFEDGWIVFSVTEKK
jgi:hypothetical protein